MFVSNKKAVNGGHHPDLKKPPTECAPGIGTNVCSPEIGIKKMREFLEYIRPEIAPKVKSMSREEVVNTLKDTLKVDAESGILNNSEFRRFGNAKLADKILNLYFNPKKPGTLLDNFNIDEKLEQWARSSEKLYGKKFYHVPFQMIDFEQQKDHLATLYIPDIIKNYDCLGVVFNTDVSTGRGIHWFSVFLDFAHKGTADDPYQLEFFNSSGNPPQAEPYNNVYNWLEHTAHVILKDTGKKSKVIIASQEQIQHSKTECGMWALIYILSRLEGRPPNWLYKIGANDSDMIKLREHLFRKY